MQVISSGKSTQLHSFPALSTDYAYPHTADERLDLQCMPERNLYLTVNPAASCFELLRKTANKASGADMISRVKKVLMNDVKCGACSGRSRNEVAIGQENGTISFYDLKKAALSATRFKPGRCDRYGADRGRVNLV